MFQKSLLLIILLSLTTFANAQTAPKPVKSADDDKLEKAAVEFLRETLSDVNSMRSLENRISFTSELAALMWFHDEREARSMFNGVTGDFRQLVAQYDAQMNFLGAGMGDEDSSEGYLIFDQTERTKIERKFRTAMAVRQQIAMGMAEHDPELAFDFYYASLNAISNPEFRKQIENTDRYFEFQLMTQIAAKDPEKAAKFASKSLAKGFDYQHLELLGKIYAKDPDKAADFARDILSRVKSEKLSGDKFGLVSSLISFGAQTLEQSRTEGGKKAIYSQTDLRDLAEVFAQAILDRPSGEGPEGRNFADQIEKYAPGRAAQIRAKFKTSQNSNSRYASNASIRAQRAVDEAAGAMNAASNSAASAANATVSAAQKARDERVKNEKQMMDDVMKVGNKDLPKEQRDSIIAQARKILLTTPGRDKKVVGLSLLAAQVARAGDKDLATQIMKDAHGLVNPQPKNYQDFLLTWMLASGYASAEPNKAFPLLDETIGRINETIAAFIKVGEFIDANEEMIQDGEIQVGAFGGSMIRGLTGELGMADTTIRVLAKADFEKTKNLTNRFDRPEARVLAKMMVLRAVLGPKNPPKVDDDSEEMDDTGLPPPPSPRKRPN